MTLDQKEKFRRILQCLSNGKLEMGRMNLQEALEYFRLAHLRAHEYADFIKINDIDKDICAKCMNGERITLPANAPTPSTGRDFSWALLHLKAGNGVKRGAWTPGCGAGGRAPHLWLRFLNDDGSRPTPVELLMTVPGPTQQMDKHIPWNPAFDDLMADDWELA